MIDLHALQACLARIGLDDWYAPLESLVAARFSPAAHGDFERWRAALARLDDAGGDPTLVKAALLELAPWRKGPFHVGGVTIDAEWRSDLKWRRVAGAIEPLDGRNVLDVGAGNGWYALEMRKAGAASVVGVDPTLLYAMQFLAVNRFRAVDDVFVLPLRLEELPPARRRFDTTFSMGVLYHQRSPLDHLRRLGDTLAPRGQLVLETLFLPGDEPCARTPRGRYARMKNVWLLPTIPELETWLQRSGFADVCVVDRSVTTPDEQRRTEWMPFESLEAALDADDPTRTVEGWPAPQRAVVTASARA